MPMSKHKQRRANIERMYAWRFRQWRAEVMQETPPMVLQASRVPRQRARLELFDMVMIGLNVTLWGSYFALYLRV